MLCRQHSLREVKKNSPRLVANTLGVRSILMTRPILAKAGIVLARTNRDTLEEAIGNDLRDGRLSPQLLNVDRLHYQRRLDQDHVAKLVETMRADPTGKESRADMLVAIRPDRTHWLLNGQHHNDAALRLGWALAEVVWFLSRGYKYERVLFDRFNRWQESVR